MTITDIFDKVTDKMSKVIRVSLFGSMAFSKHVFSFFL